MMAGGAGSGVPFPKWQIAVALGATGVIGLGYWYLRQQGLQGRRSTLISGGVNSVSIEDVQQEALANETPLERAQRFKSEGNSFFKKAKYEEAIEKYNQAIEECPEGNKTDLATFYQNRAAAYDQMKKWDKVIEDCTTALTLNEKYEKALYRRAKAHEIRKDWELCLDDITAVCLIQGFQNQNSLLMADRALKELGKIHAAEAMKTRKPKLRSKQFIKNYFMSFSEDPVYKFLMSTEEPLGEGETKGFLRAKLLFAQERFEAITAACTEEINSSESESRYIFEALSMRAALYLMSGCMKEAQEDLNTIIESEDVNVKIKVNALIRRASIQMQNGDLESCLADFAKAAELGPDIADIFHHRGQIYLLMDKSEEARRDFEKAVSLNPNFAIAVVQKCYADYRYALISSDIELLTKNTEDFRKAIEKFSTCSEAYVLYAQVLVERSDYEQAEKLYLKAMDIDPNNATVLVYQGVLALQWKGDIEKSVDLMRQAIRLDDKCEYAYETLGTVEVQRGNLIIAIDLFNKAIDLAKTELEMTHLFSLRDAAVSQLKISSRLGFGAQLVKP